MDAQRTTELEPASGENTSFSAQQERHHRRRGPPARRPTNPPAPRVAPPIPPGGSHPSPAQQQANNFDRLPLGRRQHAEVSQGEESSMEEDQGGR
ncbi:hypothetical protein DIS24_g6262 [Lasiodiplodia hormozganensis]|uniref:Uncharacterized protein n=1 Tax=Lasiodiplodia hormozganensis TaxID=869390 RepID=A0AA40CXU6_9PEZI|nr:hypothetical protein DIS24_g6262 [Lasiodiplodia hormozganensis]